MRDQLKDTVSRVADVSEIDFDIPRSLSFFSPYLAYYVKEVLGIGGEAYLSRNPDGTVSGLFIYDLSEKTGTVFTQSRDVFDYFYKKKPFDSLFAELKTEHENELYDIYNVDLVDRTLDHTFSHEISIGDANDVDAIEQFMRFTHPGINRNWVKIATKDGDACCMVKLNNQIAGVGWVTEVNGIGRLHSLYVKPQFRRIGIGRDLLYARLLWLKSKYARSAFSEISRTNGPSSRIALEGEMAVAGQVYRYFRKSKTSIGDRRRRLTRFLARRKTDMPLPSNR